MEILLNLAWVVCSCCLIGLWLRHRQSNKAPLRMQALALASVVLLLLPVISLSDDLMAMQGAVETDCAVRRALQPGQDHPSVTPHFWALPAAIAAFVAADVWTQDPLLAFAPAQVVSFHLQTAGSRPPPRG